MRWLTGTRRRMSQVCHVLQDGSGVWLTCRMLPWAAAIPILKRVLPLPDLVRMIGVRPDGVFRRHRERQIVQLAALLTRRSQGSCLNRSLLLYRFLALEGARPHLHVGFGRLQDKTEGHAWITIEGEAVGESSFELSRFVSIAVFAESGDLRVPSNTTATI